MASPTSSSIASDYAIDRAMGHAHASSGGRGVPKFKRNLSYKQTIAAIHTQKNIEHSEKVLSEQNKLKLSETIRAMNAGELDYM